MTVNVHAVFGVARRGVRAGDRKLSETPRCAFASKFDGDQGATAPLHVY
jgi:hypothetical protein